MPRRVLTLFGCLLILLTLCAAVPLAASAAPRVSHVWCFGDSYTDNGASLRISTRVMNGANPPADGYLLAAPPAYPSGRWTNGPTMAEVLATKLGVPLTDFAVGGAESSYSSYYSWLDPYQDTGLLGQVGTYRDGLGGRRADPKALYIVQVAGNDYFYYEDYALTMPGTVENVARQVVANECETVRQLAVLGAKRFLVIGTEDVALLPWEIGAGRTAAAKAYTDTVNALLPGAMSKLARQIHVGVDYFGLTAAGERIRQDAASYGLTEIAAPFELTYPAFVPGTGDPDTFFFWDEWHPTAAVHAILGKAMYKGLPAAWK
jgi:phospholipase/lecithinase/hemolysin